jgi:hypothetical protein
VRALLFIVLMLAVLTLVSLYKPALVPYWGDRMPDVLSELREGHFRDALSAAVAPDPPGTVSKRWSKPEPLGEPAPRRNEGTGTEPVLGPHSASSADTSRLSHWDTPE